MRPCRPVRRLRRWIHAAIASYLTTAVFGPGACPVRAETERYRLPAGQEAWIEVVRDDARETVQEQGLTETGKLISTYGGDCVIQLPEPSGPLGLLVGIAALAALRRWT